MKIFSSTSQTWDAMLSDIDSAKVSIEMEQYSFWDDEAGHRFLSLLEKKLDQGVKIRIICDGYGSYPLFNSLYVKSLIAKGMHIEAFNPPNISKTSSWFYHMHKKTMVIDSQIGWLGGLGIKRKFTDFRDTMARFEGPLVTDILSSFEILWQSIKAKDYLKQNNFEKTSSEPELLINYCGFGRKEIYEQLRERIQKAQKSIYLTTSYFFPDRNFFQLLLDKANAGVDVKIILRGKDDEYLPVRFSSAYFEKALRAKIGIYRFQPAIIHAKTAIIDDQWASIGSSNLDKFSFYYNIEANLASANPEFVREVNQLFAQNLKECRKIELKDWQSRPVLERIFEILIWPLHNYL